MKRREFLKNASIAGVGLVGSALIGNNTEANTPKLNPNDFAELKPFNIHNCHLEDMVSIHIKTKISYETYKILEPLAYSDILINIENNKTFVKINNKYIPILIDGYLGIDNEINSIYMNEDENIDSLQNSTLIDYIFINEIGKFDIKSNNRTQTKGDRDIIITGYTKYPAYLSLNIIVLSEQVPDILKSLKPNKNIQLFIQCNNQSNKAIYLEPIELYTEPKDLQHGIYKTYNKLSSSPTYKELLEILNKIELLDPTYENYGDPRQRKNTKGIKLNYTKKDLIARINKSKQDLMKKIANGA